MTADEPGLEVSDLTVTFPGRPPVPALSRVDLTVRTDEIMAVVGPSGSGKSTLLRAVAGLVTPESGTVRCLGRDLTGLPAGERAMALVFQEPALLPHRSVADNIGFGARARGGTREDVGRRVREAAESLDLLDVLARRPRSLSGGQRQRVALARALLRDPVGFLLDEPASSLDPVLREKVWLDLRVLRERLAVPMLYVTHDPHEALGLGDRVTVLRAGEVVQTGSPEELYRRPVDAFVAELVGPLSINLLPIDGLLVGVRPERARLAAPGQGRLSGTVTWISHAGEYGLVHVACGPGPAVVQVPWEQRPDIGAVVDVGWAAEDEHRFDPATGKRR
jgi:ABC-type sugar transport system ATPase subunit